MTDCGCVSQWTRRGQWPLFFMWCRMGHKVASTFVGATLFWFVWDRAELARHFMDVICAEVVFHSHIIRRA